jgi:hypothetical protein
VSSLPLLKLAKALACLKSPPRGRNGSSEFLWPVRDLLTTRSPLYARGFMASSLPLSSPWRPLPLCPTPATLEPLLLAPASTPATSPPRRRTALPMVAHPSRSDFPCSILIARPGPRDTASRTRALARLSALPAAAHPPWSGPLHPIQIERPEPQDTALRTRALARLLAPKPPSAGPARSASSPPLSLTLPLARLSALAHPRARPWPWI